MAVRAIRGSSVGAARQLRSGQVNDSLAVVVLGLYWAQQILSVSLVMMVKHEPFLDMSSGEWVWTFSRVHLSHMNKAAGDSIQSFR